MKNSIASHERNALISPQVLTDRMNSKNLKSYLLEAIKASNENPPDTDYQRGYLGALLVLFEDLCMTGNDRMQHRIMTRAQINTILD